MQDFPANSKLAKETAPREQLKPVTSAETVRRKRGLGLRVKDAFFAGDARSANEYVVTDVVIPAIRDTIHQALRGWLDKLILGDARPRTGGSYWSPYTNTGHVNYQGMSNKPSGAPQQRSISRGARARHDLSDLIIPTAQEANEVIDRMNDVLSSYGMVTVADLYELTGVQSSHTDMKWGWTSLRGSKARRLGTGAYLLDLPEPESFG